MKRLIFIILSFLISYNVSAQEFGHTGGTRAKPVHEVGDAKTKEGALSFILSDSTLHIGIGDTTKQVATAGDSIIFGTVYTDTLGEATSGTGVNIKSDFITLMNVMFAQGSSEKSYWTNSTGDTVFCIDPNATAGPTMYFMDDTGADTVQFYSDGTDFKIMLDAGTGVLYLNDNLDVDGITTLDSTNVDGGELIVSHNRDFVSIGHDLIVADSVNVNSDDLIISDNDGFVSIAKDLFIGDSVNVNAGDVIISDNRSYVYLDDSLNVDTGTFIVSHTHEKIGINDATIDSTLSVSGGAHLSGGVDIDKNLNVDGVTNLDSLNVDGGELIVAEIDDYVSVGHDLFVGDSLNINAGDVIVSDNRSFVYLDDSLNVDSGTLIVSDDHEKVGINDATIDSTLTVNGGGHFTGGLLVDKSMSVSDDFDVVGNLTAGTISSDATVTAATIINAGSANTGYHEFSAYNSSPEILITDTDINKQVDSEAEAEDSSAVHIYVDATGGQIAFKSTTGYNNIIGASGGSYNHLAIKSVGGEVILAPSNGAKEWKFSNPSFYCTNGEIGSTTIPMAKVYSSLTGAANSTIYHEFSAYNASPEILITDTDVNKQYDSEAEAEDSSAVHITINASNNGQIAFKSAEGDAADISVDTDDKMQFANASGGYNFDGSISGTAITGTSEANFTNNAAAVTFGAVGTDADVVLAFDAVTAQGSITYMEDEDRFDFDNDVDVIGDLTAGTIQSDGNLQGVTVTDGTGSFTGGVLSGFTSISAASGFSIDITGTGNSYAEVIQDNNAGYLAVGRTTATEASCISVTDGGADNAPGFWQMFADDGNGCWHWTSTDHIYRIGMSQPADDDAGGYAIIDADDGTIGASTQAVNGSTITGTTLTDGTISITGGALTGASSLDATNMSNGVTGEVTNWNTVKIYNDSTIAAETTLTDVLPAGYAIDKIIFKNTTASAITNLDIGFTDGGGEIVAAANVNASDEGSFKILQQIDDFDAVDTIYISAANWNSANLIIYIRMVRMF